MSELREQLNKLMPTNVGYEIQSVESVEHGFKATIRLPCETTDACDKWVAEFSRVSLCTWRTRSTYPQGRRGLLYRKDYVCQHSKHNKKHSIRQKTKDTASTCFGAKAAG